MIKPHYCVDQVNGSKKNGCKECHRLFYRLNHELRERQKKYYLENKKNFKKYQSEYRKNRCKNDPNFKKSLYYRAELRKILFKDTKDTISSLKLTGLTREKLISRMKNMCQKLNLRWEDHGTFGWHIDHIKPVRDFDLTDPEQVKKCFHYTNLRPRPHHLNRSDDKYKKSDVRNMSFKENGVCTVCGGNRDREDYLICLKCSIT